MRETTLLIAKTEQPAVTLSGINPLVAAAMPLILLIIKFKNTLTHEDVANLHRQVINEIAAFATRAKASQCSTRLILAARYCLCTALDETVLLTPWGSESIWAQQTLLSLIQKETWGGERFFIILEKMAEAPKQSITLLELIYILLSLGFEGKYYTEEKSVRDEIRHRLFRLIMLHREAPHRTLTRSLTNLKKIAITNKPPVTKIKITVITLSLLLLLGVLFNIATYFSSRKTLQELNDISQMTPGLINTLPDDKVAEHSYKQHHHKQHPETLV